MPQLHAVLLSLCAGLWRAPPGLDRQKRTGAPACETRCAREGSGVFFFCILLSFFLSTGRLLGALRALHQTHLFGDVNHGMRPLRGMGRWQPECAFFECARFFFVWCGICAHTHFCSRPQPSPLPLSLSLFTHRPTCTARLPSASRTPPSLPQHLAPGDGFGGLGRFETRAGGTTGSRVVC